MDFWGLDFRVFFVGPWVGQPTHEGLQLQVQGLGFRSFGFWV